MTDEQIEKIKKAACAVAELAAEQDEIYSKLVEELGWQEYEKAWANGTGARRNPVAYLFDAVYNSVNSLNEDIEKIINAKEEYDNGNV